VQAATIGNVFARAWNLLTRNWVIIVPGIVVGLVVGLLSGVYILSQPDIYGDPSGGASSFAYGAGTFVSNLVLALIAIAGYIITQCYTAGMAGAAWRSGNTTLSDGSRAVNDDAGDVLVAAIYLFLLGILAHVLAPYTLQLSRFAFYLFTLYTIAAAVVGGRPGYHALRESFAIARARFGTTLIVGIVLGVLQLFGGLIAGIFGSVPLLGPVVAAIVAQVVVSYAVLVVVGEYLVLRPGVTEPAQPV
jgi:hypothetical protein